MPRSVGALIRHMIVSAKSQRLKFREARAVATYLVGKSEPLIFYPMISYPVLACNYYSIDCSESNSVSLMELLDLRHP